MGLNLFPNADVLNIHEYELRNIVVGTDNVRRNVWKYQAWYEIFVQGEPDSHGDWPYKAIVWQRGTPKVLKEFTGTAASHEEARGTAQRLVQAEMEAYRNPEYKQGE